MTLTLAGKILKWLGIIALALAIVGTPIVWVNKRIKEAHDAGYSEGYKQKTHEVDVVQLEQARKDNVQREREFREAQQRQIDQAKLQQKAANAEKALEDAIKQANISNVCVLDKSSSSILRDAAKGNFSATTSEESVSSGPVSEMPGRTNIPNDRESSASGP